jgi:hypothetical protein
MSISSSASSRSLRPPVFIFFPLMFVTLILWPWRN